MSDLLVTPCVVPGWLTALAVKCLESGKCDLDPSVPLARYGMDSFGAMGLAMGIEERTGCDVLELLMQDDLDLQSLAAHLDSVGAQPALAPKATGQIEATATQQRMLGDSFLPADVIPGPGDRTKEPATVILLTGATGFLGAYLLRTLLRQTTARIRCLVRPRDAADGRERIRRNLENYGIWDPAFAHRIETVDGDLLKPNLGLTGNALDALSEDIDEIYHCAALVNWVYPYEGLRDANVGGTLELLRLACRHRPRPFHFISTLSVCCPFPGPATLTERDDVFPHRNRLHLGYAQSKCVAEALVRSASERGLPVTIHRPSWISGDSQSGVANPDDLLALMMKGCIEMGSAPDLDLNLDACPVDHIASAIVALADRADVGGSPPVSHFINPGPRPWREVVLWMNLFGYPVRLLPHQEWLACLEAESRAKDHPLHFLSPFFLTKAAGLTLPEHYEERRRPRVCAAQTQSRLDQLSLTAPLMNGALLDRYFQSFIERGFLPPVAGPARRSETNGTMTIDRRFFQDVLRLPGNTDQLTVRAVTPLPQTGEHSLLSEVTSWRDRVPGRRIGLTRSRVELDSAPGQGPDRLDVFIKVKPCDEDVMAVGESVARACGSELGAAFARCKERLGLRGSQLRELAIYEQTDPRFRDHLPILYGTVRDDARSQWILALEDLTGMELLDSADDIRGWQPAQIEATIRGLAALHAVWYGREAELLAQPWLDPPLTAEGMVELTDLWSALADHSARFFSAWVADIRKIQHRLLATLGEWWPERERAPQTLIHNDFNPRNLALRRTATGPRLCAYDWELATLGMPQRDLAELLCFVLPPDHEPGEALHYLEFHRQALEEATGRPIDVDPWHRGMANSLGELILNRLPLYGMIHSFRRQPFLERVIRTWQALITNSAPASG